MLGVTQTREREIETADTAEEKTMSVIWKVESSDICCHYFSIHSCMFKGAQLYISGGQCCTSIMAHIGQREREHIKAV